MSWTKKDIEKLLNLLERYVVVVEKSTSAAIETIQKTSKLMDMDNINKNPKEIE